jgi:hypothetical protein
MQDGFTDEFKSQAQDTKREGFQEYTFLVVFFYLPYLQTK